MQMKPKSLLLTIGVTTLLLLAAAAIWMKQSQPEPVAAALPASDIVAPMSSSQPVADVAVVQQLAPNPASPPSIHNQQTAVDPTAHILQTVSELATKQETAVLGQPGWVHVQSSLIIAEEMGSDTYHLANSDQTIPMSQLVPESPRFENWYQVDATGQYAHGLGLVRSTNGAIHQQTLFTGGQWTNLTLAELNNSALQNSAVSKTNELILPSRAALHALQEQADWRGVTLTAELDAGQYRVTAVQQYETPLENAIFMPEPVIGARETFVFDNQTGFLLWRQSEAWLQSGNWLPLENETYTAVAWHAALPTELAAQLADTP